MTEPAVAIEPEEYATVDAPAAGMPVSTVGVAGATDLRNVQAACLELSVFGRWVGWMIAALGVLVGAISLVHLIDVDAEDAAGRFRLGLRALFAVLAFSAAGWGIRVFSRFAAAVTLDTFGTATRVSERVSTRMDECLILLERIASHLENSAGKGLPPPASGFDRVREMAEIVRLARAADWITAETRLSDFETKFPLDPELSSLKRELGRIRTDIVNSGLDQLQAARAVNDADRVLEIYKSIAPGLDQQSRAEIDPDLARWFLGLIHRRLRTGTIQADVVQLAARFAESFGGTVEGASVRASLATLRRSVGLCPRCAQPYTGIADACPDCLRGGTHGLLASLSDGSFERAE